MGGGDQELSGPDLGAGIPLDELRDGAPFLGHAGGQAAILIRRGERVFAVGATCSHYGGPLADGLVEGMTLRCPWHHACFDLETGRSIAAPALRPIPCFEVEHRAGLVRVRGARAVPVIEAPAVSPSSVVIVGAGAAGAFAASTLRDEGYRGPVMMIGEDPSDPVDRPNLSKDYLAGTAPEEWIPLWDDDFCRDREIELMRGQSATGIDPDTRTVRLTNGRAIGYGALLLATGAEPIRLSVPGADLPHVHTLRTLTDSRAIIANIATAKRAVVVGASFIGLEAAASLRRRGVAVTVVAPDPIPLAKVLGPDVGAFVRRLHDTQGVLFRLGQTVVGVDPDAVTLDDGSTVDADLVVTGIGVRPRTTLAQSARLTVDRGIVVSSTFRTSAPDIYAAGDVARFPWRGASTRIEHWAVAGRQGQAAAREIVGRGKPFREVPFFWSAHYDTSISYLGHAERWDTVQIHGALERHDACIVYRDGGPTGSVQAVATINRDRVLLELDAAFRNEEVSEVERILARQAP